MLDTVKEPNAVLVDELIQVYCLSVMFLRYCETAVRKSVNRDQNDFRNIANVAQRIKHRNP